MLEAVTIQYPKQGLMRPLEGGAFAASNATVTGDVHLGEQVTIWFGCVLRGDDAAIHIGPGTNIQDLTMVHPDIDQPMHLGAGVTVGHRCILHGESIEDDCLIGMGAILLAGSRIGAGSIIGAGAVVKQGMVVPPRSLVLGLPGRVVREISAEELAGNRDAAAGYRAKVRQYLAQ